MRIQKVFLHIAFWLALLLPCLAQAQAAAARICPARVINCGALWSDGAWRGCQLASDGAVYMGFCSHAIERNAELMRYDPRTGQFNTLGDMGKVTAAPVGTNGIVPQGKIHTPFFEHNGRLYFSTTIGAVTFNILKLRKPYPGGYIISYPLAGGKCEVVGKAPEGEGIITLASDLPRDRLYALTFPSGHFLVCDVKTKEIKDLGETETDWAEAKDRVRYVDACRCLAVDPLTGKVYGSRNDGAVYCYDPATGKLALTEANVKSGVVPTGTAVPTNVASVTTNAPPLQTNAVPVPTNAPTIQTWRMMVYDAETASFYGTHRATASLFRFDPKTLQFEPLVNFGPDEQAAGSKPDDSARLGVVISPDRVIYHIAHGAPLWVAGRERQASYQAHLVSYDLKTRVRTYHGALLTDRGQRVLHCDTLSVAPDGRLYALAFVEIVDPAKLNRQKVERRGTGSSHTVAGVYFEMELIEIDPLAAAPILPKKK